MLPWSKLLALSDFSIWQGLEVIEAHYLFGAEYDNIEIVIHPQSIIHSMVETQVLLLTLSCWQLLGDATAVTCCSLVSLCGSCALEWQDVESRDWNSILISHHYFCIFLFSGFISAGSVGMARYALANPLHHVMARKNLLLWNNLASPWSLQVTSLSPFNCYFITNLNFQILIGFNSIYNNFNNNNNNNNNNSSNNNPVPVDFMLHFIYSMLYLKLLVGWKSKFIENALCHYTHSLELNWLMDDTGLVH